MMSSRPDGADPLASSPLHLVKLAVGIDDIEHLRRVRRARMAERGGTWVVTRNHPRRAEAVLAGGSIYWVIRGQIRVRQRIVGFQALRDESGRSCCRIDVDAELVATYPLVCRPFQGWRYLPPAAAPEDLAAPGAPGAAMPEGMRAELRALGLL